MDRNHKRIKAGLFAAVVVMGCANIPVFGEAETAEQTDVLFGTEIADGTYPTELETEESLGILNSLLTVENGQMTLMLLCESSVEKLYLGEASEAKENSSQWIEAVKNNKGNSTFTFGISVLNQKLNCASFDGKQWTDHTLFLSSDNLPEGAILKGEGVHPEELALEDGEYTIEVTLNGGSGRASIQSPTKLTVENGKLTAEIVWSSNHYDYMIMDNEKYLYKGEEEYSTFYLPVTMLDHPLDVIADTTAMSVPHEISYQLTYQSETINPTTETDK